MAELYCIESPHIMHETIEGEAIVVNMQTGIYYSFDGSGSEIWGLLGDAGNSLANLVTASQQRFEGDGDAIASAVTKFVGKLQTEQLIRVVDGDEPACPQADSRVPFDEPVLQKYTDMEALLLADPIHEVEDSGWPDLK